MALTKVTSGLISADASSVDLNIDAGTLYIDATNNRVGVANTSPLTTLQVGTTGISSISGAFSAHQAVDGDAVHYFFNSTQATASSTNETCQLYLGWRDAASGIAVAPRIVAGKEGDYTTAGGADSFLAFHTALDNTLGEKVRITSAGNVGIGTSPDSSAKLDILTGASSRVLVRERSSRLYIDSVNETNSAFDTLGINGSEVIFEISGTEKMRIDSSGNVGIGTIPSSLWASGGNLQLANGVFTASSGATRVMNNVVFSSALGGAPAYITSSQQATQYLQNGGAHTWYTASSGTAGNAISFTQTMSIDSSGSLTVAGGNTIFNGTGYFRHVGTYSRTTASAANLHIYTDGQFYRSTSSKKYKENITDYDKGLSEVLALRPVYYTGTGETDGDKQYAGLIAEEVHDAGLTEFVQYAEDDTPDALSYGHMVSLLTKAIQEQQTIIEDLKARITALENA